MKKMNNKGYSLVEMIIVIAIMAILATLSFVTINMMADARTSSAANTFNSELASLQTRTRTGDANEAILMSKATDGTITITYGMYDGSAFTADANQEIKKLSTRVNIVVGGNALDSTGVIIQFRKSDGSVKLGAGNYQFCTGPSSTTPYTTVRLYASTGKHEIR